MKLIRDNEYWSESQFRNPFRYVQERNKFWNRAGSTFMQLCMSWFIFSLLKVLIVFGFLFALIVGICGGNQ